MSNAEQLMELSDWLSKQNDPRLEGWANQTIRYKNELSRIAEEFETLLEAARLAASAIRNLEGQPIQYSLAKDLSSALVKLEFHIERMERKR